MRFEIVLAPQAVKELRSLRADIRTRLPQPRRVALANAKDDLSRLLRLAASEEIVITRHGRPAGVLIGFETEEDWFEYRLENHPEFMQQIREARAAIGAGPWDRA